MLLRRKSSEDSCCLLLNKTHLFGGQGIEDGHVEKRAWVHYPKYNRATLLHGMGYPYSPNILAHGHCLSYRGANLTMKGLSCSRSWKNHRHPSKPAFLSQRICITHRYRQQCGDGQRDRERGWGPGEGGQRRGNGDICNNVNNEKKTKERKQYTKRKTFSQLNESTWNM